MCVHVEHNGITALISQYENRVHTSLVPRPPPRLLSRSRGEKTFLHGCEIKSGQRPGNEAKCILHSYTFTMQRESVP